MQRVHKIAGFLFVLLLGVYGCSKGPVASVEVTKVVRARAERLEEDYKAVATSCDQLRQKLQAAEDQQAKLRQELNQYRSASARERDSLNSQLKSRTAERDTLQVQYDGFRKTLRDLIGQADTALLPSTPSTVVSKPAEGMGPAQN